MSYPDAWTKAWNDIQTLRPIVESVRDEADQLRHLPDSIGHAFIERDVYRLLLPAEYGGAGLDPLQHHKLTLELARSDASVAWNFAIAPVCAVIATDMDDDAIRRHFADPDCGAAISGAPQGKAIACDGGYRVTGRFGWASGIHQARWVGGGCFVFDGDKQRFNETGGPVIMQVVVPKGEADVLDTWHTGGMRGTGSTDFELNDVFVPQDRTFVMYSGESRLRYPFYRMPRSFFGFALSAVPLGLAWSSIEELKALAQVKKGKPARSALAESPSVQFAVSKSMALLETATLGVHEAFRLLWDEVVANGYAEMATRARLRRSMKHSADCGIEVASLCYREAGGSALFQSSQFERNLRDAYAIGGHVVFQRAMMEDNGRFEVGLDPQLPNF